MEVVAKSCFTAKKSSEDEQYTARTRRETDVFPGTGDKEVTECSTVDRFVPLHKVDVLAYQEVATRVKQYITSLLYYAVQQQLIRYNRAHDLEGPVQKPESDHRPAEVLEEISLSHVGRA